MSGGSEFAEAYLVLLSRAGFTRYEHLRGVDARRLAEEVRAVNGEMAVFGDLHADAAAEWLVRRALESGVGEIASAHLPDDQDPCWGAVRLGTGEALAGGTGLGGVRDADGVHGTDADAILGQERGAVEWSLPPDDRHIAYSQDGVLPGKSDLDYGWGGKPPEDDDEDGEGRARAAGAVI